ncbi:hypothetical protein VC218_17245 [Xanthomonas nasturtii]|uniref:hypothetical protein n=1 Tax=Xanthomonas nasturtii TaxID=1843581 RepID=UPI002B224D81|nr:hypothetical protein [Xanthomonas nasturtii]MEA9580577.1 hypothetical protein [Xanthomonas nasturtii]
MVIEGPGVGNRESGIAKATAKSSAANSNGKQQRQTATANSNGKQQRQTATANSNTNTNSNSNSNTNTVDAVTLKMRIGSDE